MQRMRTLCLAVSLQACATFNDGDPHASTNVVCYVNLQKGTVTIQVEKDNNQVSEEDKKEP